MSIKALSKVISREEDESYVWRVDVNVEATAMGPKTSGAMALKKLVAARPPSALIQYWQQEEVSLGKRGALGAF